MSNGNEQMIDDVLEPRAGIRVLANNEVEAVAGANIFMLVASGNATREFMFDYWLSEIFYKGRQPEFYNEYPGGYPH